MTFQTWVAELIEQRFGTKTALARKIEMQLSPFSRGVAAGKLDLVNLLKLAHVAEANPSMVLRLAGKGKEADLFEKVYGSAEQAVPASAREVLDYWYQLPPVAREGLRALLSAAPAVQSDPGGRTVSEHDDENRSVSADAATTNAATIQATLRDLTKLVRVLRRDAVAAAVEKARRQATTSRLTRPGKPDRDRRRGD